ncbi:MAG TPA: hypothetical protein EYH43_03295 [Persephonella sp.]|nr:hypothetical protein [Persephonella sp.]
MKTINTIKLKIEFGFLSGNENIFRFIKDIADTIGIKGILKRENDKVIIYIDGNIENVEKFLDELGKKLPLSIFMEQANITNIDTIPEKLKDEFKIHANLNVLPQNLSTCPSCLEKLFNPENRKFYYPFISCEYCGSHYSYLYKYPLERENTVFKFFQKCENCQNEGGYPLNSCFECLTPLYLKKGEHEKYAFDGEKCFSAFNSVVGVIDRGNILEIYTTNGKKLVGKITEENIEKISNILKGKPITVLITNPRILNKIAYLTETEIKALASQEKPTLIAQIKNFPEKGLVSFAENFINIKLPDEPILILLAKHLADKGINYIFIVDSVDNQDITDFHLEVDLPVINKQEDTYVFVAQGNTLIKEGEKGILPNIIRAKKTGNLAVADKFAALDLGNGEYLIDRKEKILLQLEDFVDKLNNVNILNGEFEDIKVKYKDKKPFKAYEGAILSVIAEHNKFEEGTVGIYFSYYANQDVIAVKRFNEKLKPVIWIKPSITFGNLQNDAYWVLEKIKENSEEGKRLVNNFIKKFPEVKEKLQKPQEEAKKKTLNSLTHIFNLIAYLTDIFPKDKANFFEEPYLYLQSKSLDFTNNQGLIVDFVLEEENGIFYFDWIKTIQSVLSYKIAGVENNMIAFSIFESLGNRLKEESAKIMDKLKLKNIAICGNFFSNPVLTGRFLKHFGGNYSIITNRKLPIDKQNIAFGGIFI